MTDSKTSRRDLLKATGCATTALVGTSLLGGAGAAHAHEADINAMGPTPEQLQEFLALPDGPVVMVNLLKFQPDAGRRPTAGTSRRSRSFSRRSAPACSSRAMRRSASSEMVIGT